MKEIKQLVAWGFTQTELSKILGVTHTAINKWYTGANSASKKHAESVELLHTIAKDNRHGKDKNRKSNIFAKARIITAYGDKMMDKWE